MKERPIPMKAYEVQAILEGRKTQFRRIVKIRGLEFIGGKGHENDPSAWGYEYQDREGYADLTNGIPCPYGKPGDRLWAKETWRPFYESDTGLCGIGYRAGGSEECCDKEEREAWMKTLDGTDRWRPSIHMPRWASRIILEVVSVRVERLQDITSDGVIAEGVGKPVGTKLLYGSVTEQWNIDREFRPLWENINGTRSWDANPWIWVVEFKRIIP